MAKTYSFCHSLWFLLRYPCHIAVVLLCPLQQDYIQQALRRQQKFRHLPQGPGRTRPYLLLFLLLLFWLSAGYRPAVEEIESMRSQPLQESQEWISTALGEDRQGQGRGLWDRQGGWGGWVTFSSSNIFQTTLCAFECPESWPKAPSLSRLFLRYMLFLANVQKWTLALEHDFVK